MKFTDSQTLPSAPGQIDENGFLRLRKVRLGRAGIQQYLGSELPSHLGFQDNDIVNVCRPPEEVFADDSLATLQGLPTVIEGHEWKTPDNNGNSGSVSGIPTRDGNDILGQLLITDRKAITPIQKRKLQDISLGYQADVQLEDGLFEGQPYQAIQRNIRYNHVAILRPGGGRAGDKIRIEDKRMPDNLITVDTGHGEVQITQDSKGNLKKLMDACSSAIKERDKLQDSNAELTAKVADHDSVKAELEDAKKEKEKMKGELDAKDKKLKDAEDPEELEKKAKELNDAQTVGRAIMGDKMPKGLGATKLRMAIATHYARERGIISDSDTPSEQYLDGVYGIAAADVNKNPKKTVVGLHVVDHGPGVSDARQKYQDNLMGKGGKE